MFSSVIGMADPNGGLVVTTSTDPSPAALRADLTPSRWPFGNSSELRW